MGTKNDPPSSTLHVAVRVTTYKASHYQPHHSHGYGFDFFDFNAFIIITKNCRKVTYSIEVI